VSDAEPSGDIIADHKGRFRNAAFVDKVRKVQMGCCETGRYDAYIVLQRSVSDGFR
jgi:hypothetical protein